MTDKTDIRSAIHRVAYEELISDVVNLANVINDIKRYERHEINMIIAYARNTNYILTQLIKKGFQFDLFANNAHTFMRYLLRALTYYLGEIAEENRERKAREKGEFIEEEKDIFYYERQNRKEVIDTAKEIIHNFPMLLTLNFTIELDYALNTLNELLKNYIDISELERVQPEKGITIPKDWNSEIDNILWKELTIQLSRLVIYLKTTL